VSQVYTPVDWASIKVFTRYDFQWPDRLDHSVVKRLDTLDIYLPVKPQIISDYRPPEPGSTSQHHLGRAIDFIVPGVDSLEVLAAIEKCGLFSGYGMYTNEKGVESFHVDTRTTRTTHNPATWGAWKDASAGVTSWQYVDLANIVAKISKGAGFVVLLIVGVALYVLISK